MKGNTIDLRGNEQICTRFEAEQYASFLGYEMFYFNEDLHEVGVDFNYVSNFTLNALLDRELLILHTCSVLTSKEGALSITEPVEPMEWDVRNGLTVMRDGYLLNGVRIHMVKEPGFNGNVISNALVYSL